MLGGQRLRRTGSGPQGRADPERRELRANIALVRDRQRPNRYEYKCHRADNQDDHRGQEQHRMPAGCRGADVRGRAYLVRGERSGHGWARQSGSLSDARAAADADKGGSALGRREAGLEIDDSAVPVSRRFHM
jgi:hypothetical protein